MPAPAAARRYAKALFRLAKEEGDPAAALHELDTLDELLVAEPELRDALFRPVHPSAERRRVLEVVAERLGLGVMVRHFGGVLIEHRRMAHLPEIRRELARLVDEEGGRTRAQVRSAAPLDDGQLDRLRRALSTRTGRDVQLEVEVDPSLIGGVVATVGGLVFDGSLRAQLDHLRATLMKGR